MIDLISENIFQTVAVIISICALIFSILSYRDIPKRHSDTRTADMINNSYSELLGMTTFQAQYPMQGHLYATAGNYEAICQKVRIATGLEMTDADISRNEIIEIALAMSIFAYFEHHFFQWEQAKKGKDKVRTQFLLEVLKYFTERLLRNPRLLWLWAESGANLREHFEDKVREYYVQHIDMDNKYVDVIGPYRPKET